jgi:glycosyltransferase involved in cell wall biosynthesis
VFGSNVVITICQDLFDHVHTMGAGDRAMLIENVMGGDVEEAPQLDAADVRRRWGIPAQARLILYTGTFEPYQGLDLLIDAMAIVSARHPDAALLVVGGRPEQVDALRATAQRTGGRVVFTGYQPARDISAYVAAADVLVSPRTRGTNTPLKIYSYLRAERPIVATDLLTHTQVLNRENSLLVPPQAEAFANAIIRLLDDPVLASRLAQAASELARSRYSREEYLARTVRACERLFQARAARV